MPANSDSQSPKLLEQMRGVLRLHHYAIRTERAYCDWVRRYVKFHGMKSRADLAGGKAKVEAFLTHLAVAGQVSASTQNQAFQALLFLYGRVLEQPLEGVDALRAERKPRVPEVLTPEEVRRSRKRLRLTRSSDRVEACFTFTCFNLNPMMGFTLGSQQICGGG